MNKKAIYEQDSLRIAIGRAAGKLIEAGDVKAAEEMWKQLPDIAQIPGIVKLHEEFKTNPDKTAPWNFGNNHSQFENLCGSVARVLHYASHGVKFKDNDATERWAYDWGTRAFEAGNFKEAAQFVKSFFVEKAAKKAPPAEMQQKENVSAAAVDTKQKTSP